VTQVIAFEGNGVLTEFGGGYDDWQRFSAQRANDIANTKSTELKTNSAKVNAPTKSTPTSKLSFKEVKELESLPVQLEALDAELASINLALANPDIYRDAPEMVKKHQARLVEVETAIEAGLARWEALESKQ